MRTPNSQQEEHVSEAEIKTQYMKSFLDIEKEDMGNTSADSTKTESIANTLDRYADVEAKIIDAETAQIETVSSDLVDWDGPSDPAKPMNWSRARKAKSIVVICYLTFLTPLGSTMFAPAIPEVMASFNSTSPMLSSFTVSVWVLGYFFGPLFLAPLSELYGRLYVYLTCNFLFTVANICTAVSPNLVSLIIFRFFCGTFGGCPIAIGAGTFGDLVRPERRGMIIAVWSLGPLMGPILGPIAGGFLGENVGWRWICWVLAIASGVGALASLALQEETYPPVLLARRLKKLRKSTGNPNLHTPFSLDDRKPSQIFIRGITRPLRMLLLSPIVSSLSFYQGVVYGYMYLLFTTFPSVFQEQYGFTAGTIGLTYLGMGIGSLVSLGIAGFISDRLLRHLSNKNGTGYKPEYRLPPLIPACFFIPIGLFWYGWAAQTKTHWIVPIIGTGFVGFGVNVLMMCIATYLIDAHPSYEASANAAATSVRSLIGALVPLAGNSMYEALGLGWGNSLLGFLALAMCGLPIFFWRYGERIRTKYRLDLR